MVDVDMGIALAASKMRDRDVLGRALCDEVLGVVNGIERRKLTQQAGPVDSHEALTTVCAVGTTATPAPRMARSIGWRWAQVTVIDGELA